MMKHYYDSITLTYDNEVYSVEAVLKQNMTTRIVSTKIKKVVSVYYLNM